MRDSCVKTELTRALPQHPENRRNSFKISRRNSEKPLTLIHVSLEPCTACVHHLRVIYLGNCLLCVEVMHHSAIHLTVLVKARENSQLGLQYACVPRRSFKYLLRKIQLSLLGRAATRQSA